MGTGLRDRRPDPVALTWEPYLIVAGGWLLGTVMAVPASLATAAWLAGHGWAWPANPQQAAWRAGLHPSRAATEASADLAVTVGLFVAAELALTAAVVLLVRRFWPAMTGQARTGFATPDQARQVLGVRRLRAVRREVRPDLYRRRRSLRELAARR